MGYFGALPSLARAPTPEEYARTIICAPQYVWPCDWALYIVGQRESGFVADAENPSGATGWWQIMTPLHCPKLTALAGRQLELAECREWLHNPVINTQVAYWLWLDRGWLPWRLQ